MESFFWLHWHILKQDGIHGFSVRGEFSFIKHDILSRLVLERRKVGFQEIHIFIDS